MSNAERFITAYARIERKLSEIARESKYIPFSQLLYRCVNQNRVVYANQQSLREYNELRNAIVHQRGRENEIIAEPTDSVTEDIERIADLLEEDDNILQFCSRPLRTVKPDTPIKEAFDLMDELDTSKIPVYEDNTYKGIVTLEEIARWALEEEKKESSVSEILVSRKKERVLFLPHTSSVDSAIRAFESAMKNGQNLLAIIVTDRGNLNEKPLGIITVADLPKIIKAFA